MSTELHRTDFENSYGDRALTIANGLAVRRIQATSEGAFDIDQKTLSTALGEGSHTQPETPHTRGSPRIIPGTAIFDRPDGEQEFVVAGLIPRDGLALLVGRPKSGKSFMLLQLARAVSEGKPFLGKSTQMPRRVLYLALEDGERRIHKRLQAISWRPTKVDFVCEGFGLSDDGIAWLRERSKDVGMIIIDTLNTASQGRFDENDNAEMGDLFRKLGEIAHGSQIPIIISHHAKKGATEDPFDGIRGASAMRAGCDLVLFLARSVGSRTATLSVESRDLEISEVNLTFDPITWWSVGDDTAIQGPEFPGFRVYKTLRELGGKRTAAEIAAHLGISPQAVGQQLKQLSEGHRVLREDELGSGKKATGLWSIAP